MQTVTELAIEKAQQQVFTRDQAGLWVLSRGPRLDALLKRAVANREIWRLRRGIYCLSDRYAKGKVDPLGLAQLLYGPSYISLESALSYHGWIPEAVRAVTSVTSKRSRNFDTPIGLFTYVRVPQRLFLAGARRVKSGRGTSFFLATPLKALADLVYVQGRDWQGALPVIESLRVEEDSLAELSSADFDEVLQGYKPGRVTRFLNALRKDLGR